MVSDQWSVAGQVGMILALGMIASTSYAQEKKPWQIDRLCGKIEYVQKIPSRKNTNTFSEKRKALRDISLGLYDQHENESCCSGLAAIETVHTGRGGRFEFKNTKPGNYWLGANWNGKEYKVAVVFKPEKNSSTLCSEQGLGFDDEGNADWWVTITLD